MRTVLGVACAALALGACASGRVPGDSGGDDDDVPPNATLTIDASATELVVMNDTPAHATFTATLALDDGTHRDVTATTRFSIDPTFGDFAGNELSIHTAGRTQVTGSYGDKLATASITARLKSVRVDPALSPAVVDLFTGTETPALAPQIVYPPADTIMPRNLGDFEIHWTDTHGNDVFEVSLRTELSDVRVYVRGNNGDPASGQTPSWMAFRASEWINAVGFQSAVSYRLRGAKIGTPGTFGAAPERTIQLSSQMMDGGLYYWASATMATAIGVFRHDMANPGQAAEPFLTTSKTDGHCIACHVLSRDGTRMAITYQDSPAPPGQATMVDVKTVDITPQTMRWNFGTFTPDTKQFLSVDHGVLVVRDALTQVVLATMTTTPASTWVTHPDLSPDGTQLVYVRVPVTGADSDFNCKSGQLYIRSYNAATHEFGAERSLVSDAQNNFYPSWSPDGTWILFNKNEFGSSYDDSNTSAWVIKADGSQPAVELARANQTLGITNSWVRWAPFSQNLGSTNEPMFWITLSSKRDFGVRWINTGSAQRVKRAQLWMTAFFPARATQRQDPSVPAFRLPFQNLESSNHIAQWTERVVEIQ